MHPQSYRHYRQSRTLASTTLRIWVRHRPQSKCQVLRRRCALRLYTSKGDNTQLECLLQLLSIDTEHHAAHTYILETDAKQNTFKFERKISWCRNRHTTNGERIIDRTSTSNLLKMWHCSTPSRLERFSAVPRPFETPYSKISLWLSFANCQSRTAFTMHTVRITSCIKCKTIILARYVRNTLTYIRPAKYKQRSLCGTRSICGTYTERRTVPIQETFAPSLCKIVLECAGLDIRTPLLKIVQGNQYVLVITEWYSYLIGCMPTSKSFSSHMKCYFLTIG